MLMKFCQVPVSKAEEKGIDDEKLRNKRQDSLSPRTTLSELFSEPPYLKDMYIVIELPGQFIPLSPVPPPTGSV